MHTLRGPEDYAGIGGFANSRSPNLAYTDPTSSF
jgi:hypothetical protein